MTYHAHSETRTCIENPAGPLPEGWILLDGEEARSAWVASLPVVAPAPVTYSREQYKAAIDAMLASEAASREYDDIGAACARAARPGPYFAEGCWFFDLRDYCWATSDAMAKQPPSENPPTPDELAAYLIATFSASNPKPERA